MSNIRSGQKISHCFAYNKSRLYENVVCSGLDFNLRGGNHMFDRSGKRHDLLAAQVEICKRIVNPLCNQRVDVKYVYFNRSTNIPNGIGPFGWSDANRDMLSYLDNLTISEQRNLRVGNGVVPNIMNSEAIHGEAIYNGNFPVAKILNLPTGCGKTSLTVKGILECIQNQQTQQKLTRDYREFVSSRCSVNFRGSVMNIFDDEMSIFLPNVILVYAPAHLVGVWRDTFRYNSDPNKVEVYPDGDGLIMKSFDHRSINPNKTYVYITHKNSLPKFITGDNNGNNSNNNMGFSHYEYTYGAVVIDEVESLNLNMKDSHDFLPLGMYTLMVTATPHGLGANIRSSKERYLLNKIFRHGILDIEDVANVFSSEFSFDKDSYKKRRYMVNIMADICGMHVIPKQLYDSLVHEISSKIPIMHSYNVACSRSLTRLLGLVQNGMQNAEDALRREEERLDINLGGRSIGEITQQIHGRIDDLSRNIHSLSIKQNKSFDDHGIIRDYEAKRTRLQFILKKITEELSKECNICMDEFTDNDGLYLTSCCAFSLCKGCLSELRLRRGCCPGCRNPSMPTAFVDNYAALTNVQQHTPVVVQPVIQQEVTVDEVITRGVVKDIPGFEQWVKHYDFSRVQQSVACDEVLKQACKYGLTHVIIAGKQVDTWNIFKYSVNDLYSFEVIRPYAIDSNNEGNIHDEQQRKKRKTVGRTDKIYKKFCSENDAPQVLILDMFVNKSVEVTGIDAKLTDLIIQIDDSGNVNDPSYIQLAGRALRLGRSEVSPVRVVLSQN
jgi:hypothetical protein